MNGGIEERINDRGEPAQGTANHERRPDDAVHVDAEELSRHRVLRGGAHGLS